jgi:hypothetical protein
VTVTNIFSTIGKAKEGKRLIWTATRDKRYFVKKIEVKIKRRFLAN